MMVDAEKKQIGMKTGTMLAIFFIVYGLLGAFIGYLVHLVNEDFHWVYGALIMLALGALIVLLSISSVKKSISEDIEKSKLQKGQYPELETMVADLSAKAGVATPALIVVPNKEPNAGTCGFKDESVIVVHDSLLTMLTDKEMEGVIAHEMSHLKNGDIFTTVLTGRLGSVTSVFSKYIGLGLFIAGFGMISALGASGGGKSSGAGASIYLLIGAVGFALMIIGGILCIFYPVAAVIKMAISRDREYYADEGSAMLTHKPLALANALKKMQNYEAPDKELKNQYADCMIVCHLSDKYFVERILRTHPSIENRVKRLEALNTKMRGEGIDTSI